MVLLLLLLLLQFSLSLSFQLSLLFAAVVVINIIPIISVIHSYYSLSLNRLYVTGIRATDRVIHYNSKLLLIQLLITKVIWSRKLCHEHINEINSHGIFFLFPSSAIVVVGEIVE